MVDWTRFDFEIDSHVCVFLQTLFKWVENHLPRTPFGLSFHDSTFSPRHRFSIRCIRDEVLLPWPCLISERIVSFQSALSLSLLHSNVYVWKWKRNEYNHAGCFPIPLVSPPSSRGKISPRFQTRENPVNCGVLDCENQESSLQNSVALITKLITKSVRVHVEWIGNVNVIPLPLPWVFSCGTSEKVNLEWRGVKLLPVWQKIKEMDEWETARNGWMRIENS